MNRVLTLAEVLGLKEGARVWVEAAEWYGEPAGIHVATRDGEYVLKLVEEGTTDPNGFWPIESTDDPDYSVDFRVWSLPQPPTPEELAANPWPGEDG